MVRLRPFLLNAALTEDSAALIWSHRSSTIPSSSSSRSSQNACAVNSTSAGSASSLFRPRPVTCTHGGQEVHMYEGAGQVRVRICQQLYGLAAQKMHAARGCPPTIASPSSNFSRYCSCCAAAAKISRSQSVQAMHCRQFLAFALCHCGAECSCIAGSGHAAG